MKRNGWTGLILRFSLGFALCGLVVFLVILNAPMTEDVNAGQSAFGGGQTNEARTLFIAQGHLLSGFFKEPFETVVFLFNDGTFTSYSTHEADRVGVVLDQITDNLKKMGKDLTQCLMVVHNHFSPASFTESDIRTYYILKSSGFKGTFAIYHTSTGEFEAYKDKT